MGYDECAKWCKEYGANCKDMSCNYCICNSYNNTYIGDDFGNGRCERDEEVLPESGLFTGISLKSLELD